MNCFKRLTFTVAAFGIAVALVSRTHAEPIPEKMQEHVNKGLEWLKKTQGKDGTWSANGQNPVSMTSLAALAMLMEGSTTTQGKYAENISKAADWLIDRSNKGGNRNGRDRQKRPQ